MRVDRDRRQSIADHDRQVASIDRAALAQTLHRGLVKLPSEVGTPEIILAVARPAGDAVRLKAEIAEARDQGRRVESSVKRK